MPTQVWTIKTVLEVSDGTRTLLGKELETVHVTVGRLSGILTMLELVKLLPLLKLN